MPGYDYKVMEFISKGNLVFADESRREVRNMREGDRLSPSYSGDCFASGNLYAGEIATIDAGGEVCRSKRRGQGIEVPASQPTQPKYGESAMTSEAINGQAINGGPPKPKLEWRVERIDAQETLSSAYPFAMRVSLWADGKVFATDDIKRPRAGELSARQSRKLERKIEEAKAGIMRTYMLTVRQSGPANRGL